MNKKIKDAVAYGKKRNYRKAVEILLETIKEDSENAQAYLFLGRSYYALGHYALSIQYLRMFLEREPDSAIGHFFMGRSLLVSGLVRNSVPHLKKSIDLFPDSAHARGFLGLALMKLKRFESALEYLGEAVEISPENRKIFDIYLNCLLIVAIRKFNRGDMDLAKEMFIFYTGYIENKVLPYVYLGMIERQNGYFEAALEYYNTALSISPDDNLLLFRRAILLYRIGYRDEAVKELDRLNIDGFDGIHNPDDLKEDRFLALKYFQKKNYKEAVFFGREALKNDSKDIDMHLVMGEALRKLKQYKFAKNHYERAIEIDNSRIETRYGYILLLWQTGEYDDMLNELKKLSKMDPSEPLADYYTALVYSKLGFDSETTIKALQDQIRLNPSDPFLFKFLGEEYLKAGLENLAEKWFINAEKIMGPTYEILVDLIETYKKTDDIKNLIKVYKKFFTAGYFDSDMLKDYILILYNKKNYKLVIREAERYLGYENSRVINRILANSYRLTGDFSRAEILYKNMLKEDPDNTVYLKALLFCMEKNNGIERSIELLSNALKYKKNPESDLFLILGVLLYKSGNTEKASEVFRENISRFPDDWRSYKNLGAIYREMGLDDFAERYLSEGEKRKK